MEFLSVFIFLFLGVNAIAQEIDPRFIGQFPDHCGDDASFCMTYCLTIDPGTVRARCARDMVSCICTNIRSQSIAVRFVQERVPLPPTTTTPPPPPPPPSTTTSAPIQFDYPPPEGPVPILLECDATPEANDLCHEFCVSQISALQGVCDRADQTCRCEGVSPAVVQPAPIPAVFYPRPAPPTTTTPIPTQYWNPITYGHPNYNYNLAPQTPLAPQQGSWGGYFYPSPTQPPPQGQFMTFPGQHWGGEGYHTLSEQWVNPPHVPEPPHPQMGGENVLRMETTTMTTPTTVAPPQETSSEVSVTSTVEEVMNLENHQISRKRRSARGSSPYSSVSSFEGQFLEEKSQSCSVTSCEDSCTSSGLDSCIPKCVDNTCLCLCKPRATPPPPPPPRPTPPPSGGTGYNWDLDAKVADLVSQVLAPKPVQIVNSKPAYSGTTPHPSLGLGGLTFGSGPLTQDQFLALFTPPPALVF